MQQQILLYLLADCFRQNQTADLRRRKVTKWPYRAPRRENESAVRTLESRNKRILRWLVTFRAVCGKNVGNRPRMASFRNDARTHDRGPAGGVESRSSEVETRSCETFTQLLAKLLEALLLRQEDESIPPGGERQRRASSQPQGPGETLWGR